MNISSIAAKSPYLEVLIRSAYWRLPRLVEWYNERKTERKTPPARISSGKFVDYLASQGIGRGSLIILHSSFGALRAEKESPDQVIERLLELIGLEGTLAMPAIPIFEGAPSVADTMTADVSQLVLDYDPYRTPAWTGALPNRLVQRNGSIRSLHPLNSMVAIGPLAGKMMQNNLSGEKPLPCGMQSSWYFCYLNNAKVISVGADLAHSLTLIHVAEDMQDEDWIVPNWYRERKFRVKVGDDYKLVAVRERHPKWAMHYAERTLSKDLLKEDITTQVQIDGVNIEIVDAKSVVDYLNSRNHTAYPYYLVPKKR